MLFVLFYSLVDHCLKVAKRVHLHHLFPVQMFIRCIELLGMSKSLILLVPCYLYLNQFTTNYLLFCSGASRVAMSESDSSSLNSVELDGLGMAGAIDSDTGLESMSSAETPSGKPCSLCCDTQNNDSRVESLRQDVTRLKCDKLELLRQNVVSCNFFIHLCPCI